MRLLILFLVLFFSCNQTSNSVKKSSSTIQDDRLLTYEVNLEVSDLHFYYKNEKNENFSNHKQLKDWLEKNSKELIFAVNGGMYNKDFSPQGL